MTFDAYQALFTALLAAPVPPAPYDKPGYLHYTRLNASRMNRWLRTGLLLPETKAVLSDLRGPQHWLVLTDPWCGDAAHVVPFLQKMAEYSPLITIDYELRDAEPFTISRYLTGGSKSIPKLIIRDVHGNDTAVWGPRPDAAQALYGRLSNEKADFETVKEALQKWYNADRGRQLQQEVTALVAQASSSAAPNTPALSPS